MHCASPRRQETQTALNVSYEQWREMLAVNLDAAFVIGQKLGKHMIEKRMKGRILMTTSLHAESPRNLPHYSASKAGQTMLVKELARALGPHGIRVNAIAPGAIPGGGFNAPPGMEKTSRSAASARRPMSRRWRSRCSPSASAPTSPGRPSWSTAASRSTTGSSRRI